MHHRHRLDALTDPADALPHVFLQAEGGSDALALLFPGYGYRASMPLLHYAERALLWRGADVLRLELAYDTDPAFGQAEPAARRARIRADAERAAHAALARADYRRIVLVGKSMGTLALADLVGGILSGHAPACAWLTPLLNDERLREAALEQRPPSLFAIGTADPLHDARTLGDLVAATRGRAVVVEGADHSLDVPGDMAATLHALHEVMDAFEGLLDTAGLAPRS